MLSNALAYAREHAQMFLASLTELLAIPSVSMEPEHAADMVHAAEWLADYLQRIGMSEVDLLPSDGRPLLYAAWQRAGPDAPTLLLYGHYDVQPVDPLAEWRTPPFTPTRLGDDLFARGASDDKGQTFACIAALEAYLQSAGRLPINVKLIIEGEEEVSSTFLRRFVVEQSARLACDAVLLVDSSMLSPTLPLVMYGARGNCYMEIEVVGPATDLHSGAFGGAVENPFNVLARLLAGLQDAQTRRVLVDGFYDAVHPLQPEEQTLLAGLPLNEAALLHMTGAPALAGETGYSAIERATVRPTLDIHGISGGFTGPGKKTVIPARASAKFSMRLVPDQDPLVIARLVEEHLRCQTPPTVTLTVKTLSASRPAVVDYRLPLMQTVAQAYQAAFGAAPALMRGGGTLPIMADFQDALAAPLALIGFGLPDDNLHAPNEKLHLPCFYHGIEMMVHCLAQLATDA
jgi:acetylornithine deacetylase/succinyl-diaminopimelate desuccinylase-like protein